MAASQEIEQVEARLPSGYGSPMIPSAAGRGASRFLGGDQWQEDG